LHWCGQQKLIAKSIKPTPQKKQNTIMYYLHTQAHKRNTNKRRTLAQSNYTNTKLEVPQLLKIRQRLVRNTHTV